MRPAGEADYYGQEQPHYVPGSTPPAHGKARMLPYNFWSVVEVVAVVVALLGGCALVFYLTILSSTVHGDCVYVVSGLKGP